MVTGGQVPDPDAAAVFRVVAGAGEGPLVIDASRGGTRYPPEFLPVAPFDAVHAKIAPYVDRLVLASTAEGATVLVAEFPPSFVDPNRPVDDIDPDVLAEPWPDGAAPLPGSLAGGSGLVHTLDARYGPLYDRRLAVAEVRGRIDGYYTPYHRALAELLAGRRDRFGTAFQLSVHSMSSIGPRDGAKRPQICLGDLNGASTGPQYRELVAGVFRASGLEVELNSPFPGNELLRRHAAPADGIHGVQVEVRRDLYLDERTRVLHEGLGVIQDCIGRIAAALRPAG